MHQIGVGVLGPVFRTYQPSEDRLVAVKVFHLDITPEQTQALVDSLTMFIEADLSHPGIATPIEVGLEDGVPYLAQEYVAADSLDVAMRHYAPAAVEKAIPLIRHMSEAIDAAHKQGIVHGALHLRDIFLTPDDVRITGLGVVKALEELRLAGPIRRPYTAPEVISGVGWGNEADLFALAAVAYEILTGRRAAGTGDQVTDRLSAVDNVADSEALQAVFATALSNNPDDRYSTAERFISSLESAIGYEGDPIPKLLSNEVSERSQELPDLLAGLDFRNEDDVFQPRSDIDDRKREAPSEPPSFNPVTVEEKVDASSVVDQEAQDEHVEDYGAESEPVTESFEAGLGSEESISDEQMDEGQVSNAEETLPEAPDLFFNEFLESPDVRDRGEAGEEVDSSFELAQFDRGDVEILDEGGLIVSENLDDRSEKEQSEGGQISTMKFSDGVSAPQPSQRESFTDVRLQPTDQSVSEQSMALGGDGELANLLLSEEGIDQSRSNIFRNAAPIVGLALAIVAVAYFLFVRLGTDDVVTDKVLGDQNVVDSVEVEFSEEVVSATRADGGGVNEENVTLQSSEIPLPETMTLPLADAEPSLVVPVVGSGWILVRTEPPGATVTVDGINRGEAPVALEDVAYGDHDVGVELAGYSPIRRVVTVSDADTVARVGVTLERMRQPEVLLNSVETGSLEVESRPAGASIIVDGEFTGTTPTRLNLPVGRHVIELELDGYQAWSKAIEVSEDEENRVAASMDRSR